MKAASFSPYPHNYMSTRSKIYPVLLFYTKVVDKYADNNWKYSSFSAFSPFSPCKAVTIFKSIKGTKGT